MATSRLYRLINLVFYIPTMVLEAFASIMFTAASKFEPTVERALHEINVTGHAAKRERTGPARSIVYRSTSIAARHVSMLKSLGNQLTAV